MINRKNITQRTAITTSPSKSSRPNSPAFDHTACQPCGTNTSNPGTISPASSNLSSNSDNNNNSSIASPTPNQHFYQPASEPSRNTSSTASNNTRNIRRSSSQFHPKLITSQIIALQSIHYLILSILIQVNHILFGSTITIDRIFTADYINIWSAEGWVDGGAILLSSILGSVVLAIVVEKSKKCLDFAVTLFIIHLLLCSMYNGFPASFDWWIIHVLGLIILVLLGECLCSKVELRDIPLL